MTTQMTSQSKSQTGKINQKETFLEEMNIAYREQMDHNFLTSHQIIKGDTMKAQFLKIDSELTRVLKVRTRISKLSFNANSHIKALTRTEASDAKSCKMQAH